LDIDLLKLQRAKVNFGDNVGVGGDDEDIYGDTSPYAYKPEAYALAMHIL
jgi:hypothetical protein